MGMVLWGKGQIKEIASTILKIQINSTLKLVKRLSTKTLLL